MKKKKRNRTRTLQNVLAISTIIINLLVALITLTIKLIELLNSS